MLVATATEAAATATVPECGECRPRPFATVAETTTAPVSPRYRPSVTVEKATAAGLTLQQQFAKLEAANPFVREVEPLKAKEKPVKVRLASDLTGLLDQLGLSKSIRSKVVSELKKHEIYKLETAQSLRVEDWDMLDLKMGTRRLILAKLGALGGSYLGSLTDPSQGCARP